MSKSLKNFITIQQALQKNSASDLRLMFLLHSWKDTLDYSENTMEMATQYKKYLNVSYLFGTTVFNWMDQFKWYNGLILAFFLFFKEFFLNVKDLLRRSQNDENSDKMFQTWTNAANELQRKFNDAKASIHLALCDNIDTRTVLDVIRNLIGHCNVYIHDASDTLNHLLLKRIAVYVTKILRIFGVIHDARDDIGFPLDAGKSTDVSFSHCVSFTKN